MKFFDRFKREEPKAEVPSTEITRNVPQIKRALMKEEARWNDSLDFYGLTNVLPNPDPFLKQLGVDQKVYEDISSDPHLYGCIQSRKAGVLSLEWEIEKGSASAKETKEIKRIFEDLDTTDITRNILDAPLYGYNTLEIVWDYVGNIIAPTQIHSKPRDWFLFDMDRNIRFKSKNAPFEGEELNQDKFLVPRYEANYINPYGTPLLSKCYWNVMFKRNGKEFWLVFTETFGMPWVLVKFLQNATKQQQDDIMTALHNMVQNGILGYPETTEVALTAGSEKANPDIYEKLIQDARLENSIVILGHTGSSMSTPGKLGGEDTAQEAKQFLIDSDKRLVEKTYNKLIRLIHKHNFTGSEIPVFKFFEEEDVKVERANRDQILVNCGVKFTPEYWANTYNIDPKYILSADAPAPDGTTPPEPDKKEEPAPDEEKKPAKDFLEGIISYEDMFIAYKQMSPTISDENLELLIADILEEVANG